MQVILQLQTFSLAMVFFIQGITRQGKLSMDDNYVITYIRPSGIINKISDLDSIDRIYTEQGPEYLDYLQYQQDRLPHNRYHHFDCDDHIHDNDIDDELSYDTHDFLEADSWMNDRIRDEHDFIANLDTFLNYGNARKIILNDFYVGTIDTDPDDSDSSSSTNSSSSTIPSTNASTIPSTNSSNNTTVVNS